MASSFYSLFYLIFQIPNTVILEKIGKKKSIVLGQALNAIAMLLTIWCPNFIWLIMAKFFSSIGFGLKGIAESNFLNCSLPKSRKKGEIFSKIDGRGYSKFCYIGASSVLLSGFLYSVNPYIPLLLCLISNVLAMIMAMNFIDIEKLEDSNLEKKEKVTTKQEIKNIYEDLIKSLKFIFKSKRLRNLLIMLGFVWAMISVFATFQETTLKEMKLPSYTIGIILASFQMLVGISATHGIDFHNRFRNKSLTVIGLALAIGSTIIGITLLLPIPFPIQLMMVVLVFAVRAYVKGAYQINKKRYMANFSEKTILPKIYSINGITTNLGKMVVGFLGATILKSTNIQQASLIMGIFLTVAVIILYFYTKNKVGLKPEQYKKEDIDFYRALQEQN